jgi:hypothetical protein
MSENSKLVERFEEEMLAESSDKKLASEVILSLQLFAKDLIDRAFLCVILNAMCPAELAASESAVDDLLAYLKKIDILLNHSEHVDLVKLNRKKLVGLVQPYTLVKQVDLKPSFEAMFRAINKYLSSQIGGVRSAENREKILNCTFSCVDYERVDLRDTHEMAKFYENVGNYFMLVENDHKKAMEFYMQSLKIYEKVYSGMGSLSNRLPKPNLDLGLKLIFWTFHMAED